MSLKAVHIAFIFASVLLSFGVGIWLFQMFLINKSMMFIAASFVSCATGLGLIVYGVKFLKKLKHVSFL